MITIIESAVSKRKNLIGRDEDVLVTSKSLFNVFMPDLLTILTHQRGSVSCKYVSIVITLKEDFAESGTGSSLPIRFFRFIKGSGNLRIRESRESEYLGV